MKRRLAVLLVGVFTLSCLIASAPAIASDFRRIEIGHDVVQWFPVDVLGDGTYDLAIRFNADPSRVGLFDPESGTWIDGPHDWPFTGSEWGVADYDGDQRVEYAYRSDTTIYMFDPDSGEHTPLWSFSMADPATAFFWGKSDDGVPLVGLNRRHYEYEQGTWTPEWGREGPWIDESWTISVHEVHTGTHVRWMPAGPSPYVRIHGLPYAGHEGLVIHRETKSQDLTPHVGYNDYLEEVCVVKSNWETGMRIGIADKRTLSGPLDGMWLGAASCVPTEDDSSAWLFIDVYDGFAYDLDGGAWVYQFLESSPRWELDHRRYLGVPVGFDLDQVGTSYWILPLSSGEGWETRELSNGSIIDTLPGLPIVRLQTFPLMQAGTPDLFYLDGSGLYIWGLTTDVADNESTAPVPRNLELHAYPNPFNASVTLTWTDDARATQLEILNILGQRVRTYDFDTQAEPTSIEWDGRDRNAAPVPSGVYFARIIADRQTAITKIVLLK